MNPVRIDASNLFSIAFGPSYFPSEGVQRTKAPTAIYERDSITWLKGSTTGRYNKINSNGCLQCLTLSDQWIKLNTAERTQRPNYLRRKYPFLRTIPKDRPSQLQTPTNNTWSASIRTKIRITA